MASRYLVEFGKAFIPDRIRPYLKDYLLKAGIIEIPYELFGAFFVLSLSITYLTYLLLLNPIFSNLQFTGITLAAAVFIGWSITNLLIIVIIISGTYLYLDLKIFHRTKQMESVLIEFLEFVADNLKGGMSFDRALWSAVKPKFKVLASEIRIAAKKSMTGEDVEEALEEFTQKYDSHSLKRSFSLIIEGMRGGSQIADIIDKVVLNLKETRELKEDMSATALSYTIFISFIVLIIAPGLFALSRQLLIVMSSFATRIGASVSTAGTNIKLPIKFDQIAITPADFSIFAFLSLVIISGFAAMVISIIKEGTIKDGIKYIPVFIIISAILFKIFSGGLEFVMSGLIQI